MGTYITVHAKGKGMVVESGIFNNSPCLIVNSGDTEVTLFITEPQLGCIERQCGRLRQQIAERKEGYGATEEEVK